MLSQEVPTAEVLKPQHDAEADKAAPLVPNHTAALSLEGRAHLLGMVEWGWRGLKFQPRLGPGALLCAWPCGLLQNPCFPMVSSLSDARQPPPCTPTPASIGHPQLQGKETPTLPGEFPVSWMRKLKVGGAVPGPGLCDRQESCWSAWGEGTFPPAVLGSARWLSSAIGI